MTLDETTARFTMVSFYGYGALPHGEEFLAARMSAEFIRGCSGIQRVYMSAGRIIRSSTAFRNMVFQQPDPRRCFYQCILYRELTGDTTYQEMETLCVTGFWAQPVGRQK